MSSVPASLVAKYLDERGIIVEKPVHTTLSVPVLQHCTTKPKPLEPLRALTEFKRAF